MSTNVEIMRRDDGNHGGGSLRSLVGKNEEAMHKVASKLGELTALRREIAELMKQAGDSHEAINVQLQALAADDSLLKSLMEGGFQKVGSFVSVGNKNLVTTYKLLKKEVTERQQLQKQIKQAFERVDSVLNQQVKRQKQMWWFVGVVGLSLVFCLGYGCYELAELKNSFEKTQGVSGEQGISSDSQTTQGAEKEPTKEDKTK